MKVTRGETSKDRKMDNRGDRSVFDRLDMGRSWNRAQDRLDRQERGVRGTNSESPRKTSRDLRTKIKKSFKSQNPQDADDVHFIKPISMRLKPEDQETDPAVLARRAKQIEFGKNTVDYDKYSKSVRKDERLDRMPRTPNKNKKYSRRQWDGLVKAWKQSIHTTVAQLEGGEDFSCGEEEDDTRRRKMDDDEEEDELFDSCHDVSSLSETTGRQSSSSWAEEVDEEFSVMFRSRAGSSTSTDQGLGRSRASSTMSLEPDSDI